MIRFVVRSGRALNVPVSLCGEMAASPEMIPVLLGLGLRELSCPPRMVPLIREAIRATDVIAAARAIDERTAAIEAEAAGREKNV
jgi:phosphotransferase system enzyme I (PtsI)